MAKRLSTIFSPSFMLESVKRQGVLASIEAGLKLLSHRFKQRFYRTRVGRALVVLLTPTTMSGTVLSVVYDLGVSAPGYDIVNFLVLAEKWRLKRGYEQMHVFFVPPEGEQTKKYEGTQKLLDSTDYVTRLQTILAPACYLFSSCNGFTVCATRRDAFDALGIRTDIFPARYTVQAPVSKVKLRYFRQAVERGEVIPSIRAPELMKKNARHWLESVAPGKRVITITLRESSYVQDRNSNIDAWAKFAHRLQADGQYFPVLIRDTERIAEKLPSALEGLTTCPEASINVLFRTAIYEESYLNMVINNGPAMLCLFDKYIRYLFFKIVTPSNPSTTVEFLIKDQGMYPGEPFPGAGPFQKLVWEDDNLDVIEREFQAMCDLIEGAV